jgi:hypothetical protein
MYQIAGPLLRNLTSSQSTGVLLFERFIGKELIIDGEI